jgi:hypothetical protein
MRPYLKFRCVHRAHMLDAASELLAEAGERSAQALRPAPGPHDRERRSDERAKLLVQAAMTGRASGPREPGAEV